MHRRFREAIVRCRRPQWFGIRQMQIFSSQRQVVRGRVIAQAIVSSMSAEPDFGSMHSHAVSGLPLGNSHGTTSPVAPDSADRSIVEICISRKLALWSLRELLFTTHLGSRELGQITGPYLIRSQ